MHVLITITRTKNSLIATHVGVPCSTHDLIFLRVDVISEIDCRRWPKLMNMDIGLDPMVAAANVYKLIDENDRVRILKVVYNPGDGAKMHHHPEHFFYVLKGGKAMVTSEGKTDVLDLKEGSVVFLPAQNHETKNIGNSILELLEVELKK